MSKLDSYKRKISNVLWSARRVVSGRRPNVLFITCQNRISASQIFPFYFFRESLLQNLDFDFHEVSISNYQSSATGSIGSAEIVLLQPWWDIKPERLQAILAKIGHENPVAKIIFLDCFAPLDLRLAQYVSDSVDLYVKKQVFRDRSRYGSLTKGDTNLVDYYGKLYGLEYPETVFPVTAGFLDKLVIGPGFATADYMLPIFINTEHPVTGKRDIDLHARLGGGGEGWYGKMRDHARAKVKGIHGIRVAAEGAVDHSQYMLELQSSKICFSPFGFGEVCWRDYEAVMCGALLIKPDMSHVETDPDIFRPLETYIPVCWDFSDLEEKVSYYLKHEEERKTISLNAYQTLSNYFKNDGFLNHVKKISGELGSQ